MMLKWLKAFRLRTLPLSLACVGMGSFLAAAFGNYKSSVMWLTIITTVFLQILSNLANDYGDSTNGADHLDRKGPSRSVQSGEISLKEMKTAIIVFVLLSLSSGLFLLINSLEVNLKFLLFFMLGLASIAAAIYYTMGSNPYGYAGFGDFFVFVFFGWVAVLGTFYLHSGNIDWNLLLPASTCGLLSVGVLNVNNIRDIESDKVADKKSIPVRIGREAAVVYHFIILSTAIICAIAFVLITYRSPWQFLFLAGIPLFIRNMIAVRRFKEAHLLDPFLKQLALSTLLFVVLFGVGQLLTLV